MSRLVTLFAFLYTIVGVLGRSGVDLSVFTDSTTWDCLVKEHNITFAIIRSYRSTGLVDVNSANTIAAAVKAGVKDVDAYMFPCISTSPYSLSHNITCASAEQQVEDTLKFLATNGVGKGQSVNFGRMWIDIEDEVPSKYFDPDTSVNLAIVGDMVAALEKRAVRVGIYTTKTYWTNIMANDLTYGRHPLWYPRYDGVDTFDFFVPFGPWTELYIKQTAGDAPLCSLTQVDTDYMLN